MKKQPHILPVVSLGAEYLVMGHLMRRNILTYKAPPNNEGYDIICINPNQKMASKTVRVQVKSRYQSDGDGGVQVSEKSFDSFDYLVVAFLNIGFFFRKGKECIDGRTMPKFYALPVEWIRRHHRRPPSGRGDVPTRGMDIDKFKNEQGFDLIAKKLKIPYPSRLEG